MRTLKEFNVTLPNEKARQFRANVTSREYADESGVIRGGLYAQATEAWLKSEVLPAFDAMRTDPSRARSLDDLRRTLATEQDGMTGKR